MKKLACFVLFVLCAASTLPAQKAEITVPLRFDQYYTLEQVTDAARGRDLAGAEGDREGEPQPPTLLLEVANRVGEGDAVDLQGAGFDLSDLAAPRE